MFHAFYTYLSGVNHLYVYLQVTFEPEPRRQYLKLLGYDSHELSKKVCACSVRSLVNVHVHVYVNRYSFIHAHVRTNFSINQY